jgi:hypothetical protein
MLTKKKKILFGAVDIGWRIEHYSKFIREHYSEQIEATSFVKYYVPKKHFETHYTYMYNFREKNAIYGWIVSFYIFIISLFKFNIFHFFSGETLLTRKLRKFEFIIYKILGKKIIMHFVGTDIRSVDYILWKEKHIYEYLTGNIDYPKSVHWQNRLIKDSLKYADSIIVSSPDLKSVIPSAIYYPVMIDIEKTTKELLSNHNLRKDNSEIVILHAPSNPQMKGSQIIHDILKKFKHNHKEYNIRLELTADTETPYAERYSTSRYRLFQLYNEADIVIDQIIIGWYGLQAIEALVAKNQVISYVENDLKQNLYPKCPIEIADVNNLNSIILKCVKNHVERKINFEENIAWVKKYHTIENNNFNLIESWGLRRPETN